MPSATNPAAVDLTVLGPDANGTPGWSRVPGHSARGTLGTPLPAMPLPRDGGLFRVVVREVEQFLPNPAPVGPPAIAPELTERTVFLDVVSLPVD